MRLNDLWDQRPALSVSIEHWPTFASALYALKHDCCIKMSPSYRFSSVPPSKFGSFTTKYITTYSLQAISNSYSTVYRGVDVHLHNFPHLQWMEVNAKLQTSAALPPEKESMARNGLQRPARALCRREDSWILRDSNPGLQAVFRSTA